MTEQQKIINIAVIAHVAGRPAEYEVIFWKCGRVGTASCIQKNLVQTLEQDALSW